MMSAAGAAPVSIKQARAAAQTPRMRSKPSRRRTALEHAALRSDADAALPTS
jgi:hypothetical protein